MRPKATTRPANKLVSCGPWASGGGPMRRRDFITLLGGAAAWPLAAHAQQPERMRGIGVLMPIRAHDSQAQARVAALAQGLHQFGWIVGRNVQIETRWSGGSAADTLKYAAELVAPAPDVIVANGGAAGATYRASFRSNSA